MPEFIGNLLKCQYMNNQTNGWTLTDGQSQLLSDHIKLYGRHSDNYNIKIKLFFSLNQISTNAYDFIKKMLFKIV